MKKILVVLFSFCFLVSNTFAGQSTSGGTITNLTSIPEGLLIMISSGVPDNANQSSFGYLFISKEYTAMISTVLICWTQKTPVTVYTNGSYFNSVVGGQYGKVIQVDPTDSAM